MSFAGYREENGSRVYGGFSCDKTECEILGYDTDGWSLLVKYEGRLWHCNCYMLGREEDDEL